MAFDYEWTVHAADTDFSGAIYTPAAIDYSIRAMEELLEEIDYAPYQVSSRDGMHWPTARVQAEFTAPIRAGDTLQLTVVPTIGDSSITFSITGHRDGVTVFESELVHVLVDSATGESITVPDEIRAKLAAYTEE